MGNTLSGTNGEVDVLIIGGGPTGIGAAYRLEQYGHTDWLLVDAERTAGGHAGTIKTKQGFRFDHGYKQLFSRYKYVDKLLEKCFENSSKDLVARKPVSYVYMGGVFIRYPIQNNLSGLPNNLQENCILELIKAKLGKKNQSGNTTDEAIIEDKNLDVYLAEEWGEPLANIFFRPYFFKSFAIPTAKLSASWATSKIPPSQLGQDIEAVMSDVQRDPEWGAASRVVHPNKGGLTGLWRTITRSINKDRLRYRSEIVEINAEEKFVRTKDDVILNYNTLISTMPLPTLLGMTGRSEMSMELANTSLHLICLGIRGKTKHPDITGCIYYPESDCIFHKVCIYSNFDTDAVPPEDTNLPTLRCVDDNLDKSSGTGPYWSLIVEVSGGPLKEIEEASLVDDVIRNCCVVGLLLPDDEIVSIHFTEMTHGNPLPTLGCEQRIDDALMWLRERDIYSRGKFGSFKYYLGDLDQCIVQGVESVDNIIKGVRETAIWSRGSDVSGECIEKIKAPTFDIIPLDDDTDNNADSSVVSAADIRGAITKEPSNTSTSGSNTVTSSISNLSPPSSDLSEEES